MNNKEKVKFNPVGGSAGDEVDVIITSSARIDFLQICEYVQDILELSTLECKQKYLPKLFVKSDRNWWW